MLFPNLGSELMCLVLFGRSENIFEKPKKLVCTENFPHIFIVGI
jgi:hypothetical protein